MLSNEWLITPFVCYHTYWLYFTIKQFITTATKRYKKYYRIDRLLMLVVPLFGTPSLLTINGQYRKK